MSYEVTVTQTDTTTVVFSDDSITETTVMQTVSVLPYTNYTVSVAASTSAGQGPEESVIKRSPEAGILMYTH